jgi:DNA replication protein DnaC
LGYVRADVPVEHPNFGKLQPCVCRMSERSQRRIDRLRSLGNLNVLAEKRFDNFIPEGHGLPPQKQENLRTAYETARAYAENPSGWLLLKGGYGCGKTHLAAAIANARIEHGQPVLFITVPDLLDHLRAAFGPTAVSGYDTRFEEIRTVSLLILDDLGTEAPTSWAQEKLFQILNYRYNARLPTVITTNHELEEIPLRLRSRLNDPDVSQIVHILAPDYRGSGIMPDQSDLSSLYLHVDQTFDTFELRKGELPREEAENLQEALEIARSFAERPQGWLAFLGTFGCGKTHLAAAIANHRFRLGSPVLFILVPDLLDHLRATFNPQSVVSFDKRFEEIRRASLLVLDDLGTESATPWAREKLYQIFDYRYNARLPTVITTSFPVEELDPRLATRMLDVSRCTLFAILAPSYRASRTRRRKPRRS